MGEEIDHSPNESAALLEKLDELEHELDGVRRENSSLKDKLDEQEK
jgi:uncharacterized membrane protein